MSAGSAAPEELQEGLREAPGGGGPAGAQLPAPPPQQSIGTRVANLPLVSSACSTVSSAYASTRQSHPCVRSVCDLAERGGRTLRAAAASGAQPLLTRLEPQLSAANEYACKGLDKLEEKLPILQQPTETVVAGSRRLVSHVVTGLHGAVERTWWALSTGISTVLGSRLGQLLARSEEQCLPGGGEERVTQGTGGTEVSPRERRWQSCTMRVGSLLPELHWARHSVQQALTRLHHVLELMEQSMEGPLHSAWQRLHRVWLPWGRQHGVTVGDHQAEARMLVVLRGLLGQLRAACTHLAARGLPGTVQGVQGVHTPLVRARSLHELSDTVLAQSRKKALQAQESIEEMLEYVGQHAALPWIVGPFAPALVECPDDSQVQMAKWEGCVTVGHGEHSCPQWGAQHQGLGGAAWDS